MKNVFDMLRIVLKPWIALNSSPLCVFIIKVPLQHYHIDFFIYCLWRLPMADLSSCDGEFVSAQKAEMTLY